MYHYRWKAACLTLMNMFFDQGGIFIVPHLIWHVTSVFAVWSKGSPHLVTFNDKQGMEELFLPGTKWRPCTSLQGEMMVT